MFFALAKATQSGSMLAKIGGLFTKYSKTFQSNSWGTTVINTMDSLVKQIVLANSSEMFDVGPSRILIAYHRSIAKRTFSVISSLEGQMNRLPELIPRDGSTIDLQPLLKEKKMDDSTEDFISIFDKSLIGLHAPMFLGRLVFIRVRDTKLRKDISYVHDSIDRYVEMAIDSHRSSERPVEQVSPANYVYLDDFVKKTKKKTNFEIKSRDSTSSATRSLFFRLARHPDVWVKLLHKEFISIGDTLITFDLLKSMKYLKFVVNESLRLLAPAGLILRTCVKDFVLPTGGRPDGQSPFWCVLVRKLEQSFTHYIKLRCLGRNTMDFRPERWENLRTTWEYAPFLGSGRICPAQQMALTEVSIHARISIHGEQRSGEEVCCRYKVIYEE
ncbi:uncharacterized protein EAF01_009308 [Botrytis porri]|uniref:uncharacterized protein n=1 Tax=Botrytis porri TaxID=87229 RepID=UPI00190235E7|nr:uncharacterized protein EAF01_009308 [Botrytis porri]KAF7896905.1 hypothetical protein EAF01_009308 [Botrytis porri]